MQDGPRRADHREVMRLARPLLVVLFALALAPAASADHGAEPDHRDTPADLAGADITRTLALSQATGMTAPSLAQFLPTDEWCGPRLTSDDVDHAVFTASQRQIKVVYAFATGEQDRSAEWSQALQADVSNIEQYLALQTGGRRALRFDMGTACGPQYVDVQVVALTHLRTYYRDDPTHFDRLADEVAAAIGSGPGPRDVLILADKLTDDPVWGIAEVIGDDRADAANASNTGGLTAIMWTRPTTAPDPSDWWQPTVILHEITHNLGGIQQSAPHKTSGWHCWDGEDVMCYDDGSSGSQLYTSTVCPVRDGAIPQTYDCGHDDYFNPAPAAGSYLDTHWNVYRSAFMAPCTQLGAACGDNIVPTVPVNTALPTVTGSALPGALLTASAGTWLNSPTTYALQWQRSAAGDWASVPGATGANYVPASADAGAALRVVVTATNADGSAVVASAPTPPVGGSAPAPAPAVLTQKPAGRAGLRIALRDRAHHAKGTLAASVVVVPAGREVRTAAAKISVTAGTWRLRLCAGPKRGPLRCALTKRVRTRSRSVRLPAARVLVRSATGALRVTAAIVDRRQRVRAQGSAAST
jgi:hypothetical protein